MPFDFLHFLDFEVKRRRIGGGHALAEFISDLVEDLPNFLYGVYTSLRSASLQTHIIVMLLIVLLPIAFFLLQNKMSKGGKA